MTNQKISNFDEMKIAAQTLRELGAKNVFLKGGHLGDGATDILLSDDNLKILRGEPVKDGQVHGTGCILSSIIAVELGKGNSVLSAALKAKAMVNLAIKHSLKIGRGHNVADWERM